MSKFSQYEAFVAVVDKGSISLAAHSLNLTPSALSKQIANLEAALNAQLFDRSNKKLRTTERGYQFYQSAVSILKQISLAESQIKADDETVAGELRITLSKSLLGSSVLKYLSKFSKAYPQVRYRLTFSEAIESFQDSELDFAFRIGELADSSKLVAKVLKQVKPIFYATPKYLSDYGVPKEVSTLATHRVALPPLENLSSELRQWLKREQFTFVASNQDQIDDLGAIHQLVLEHGCIGFNLEDALVEPIDKGLVINVFPHLSLPSKPLSLVYRKTQHQSELVRVFKEFILKQGDIAGQSPKLKI
ncbi:LysR family transcriptional regulator [Pseudoalteromonas piscicida]|uniref:LysR family transcriptional regulator n=1 Tax=Pseudoalteromonas piscicida TaxID=43662 RepID=UPI001554A4E7|nr:LysR family transcriptional regulator [Pseudoalteromonas piscicida]